MIIRILPYVTLKGSSLNSRGYAVPPDRWIQTASTLKGSPVLMGDYHDEWMGDPFRVDVPPVVLSAGRSDLRILSGDAFSVSCGHLQIIIYNYNDVFCEKRKFNGQPFKNKQIVISFNDIHL